MLHDKSLQAIGRQQKKCITITFLAITLYWFAFLTVQNLNCLYHPELTNLSFAIEKARLLGNFSRSLKSVEYMRIFPPESQGKLSPGKSRAGDSIYLWHGSQDEVVLPLSAQNSYHFLRQFTGESSIYLDNGVAANHGLSSFSEGTPCGQENTATFVERCNVSTVQRMLNHLFPATAHLKKTLLPTKIKLKGSRITFLKVFFSTLCLFQESLMCLNLSLNLLHHGCRAPVMTLIEHEKSTLCEYLPNCKVFS